MPEQWTAEIIGKMHLNCITAKELSAQLGYNPKYVSAVMNGHREPKGAEQRFNAALDELITAKGRKNL
jgi:nitroimidazol reductase NimA-like FMN-containing flavoprotein (pyridoxamine 5'-phosphate oxidase superfamily)